MTSWLPQIDALWPLAGWTMLHFLWFGVAVAVAGGGLRLACRRAAPNVRYAASLTTLAALAVAPAIIAAWLHVHAPPTAWQGRALPGDHAALGQGLRYLEPTPGQSPALPGAAPIVIDLAREAPLANPASPPPSRRRGGVGGGVSPAADIAMNPAPSANPSPGPSLRGRGIVDAVVLFLPWIWLVGAPPTFALLAAGLIGSDRLRRRGTPIDSGAPYEACQRLQTALRITRRVSLAACDCVAQPVLIGIVRPLVLLPAAALSGWTPEELQMVLVHELAHVRRWDNLVNLAQRIIESLLFFHPAVWLVSRQVRRDREECCDAVVVRHTGRRREYAELLVGIAAAVPRGQAPRLTSGAFAAYSPMASHPLAGRIRRILTIEEEPMGITRRTLAAMIGLPLVAVAATVYTAAADEEANNPPPSKAGARGGIATPAAAPSPTEQPKPATQPEPTGPHPPEAQEFTFTQTTKNSDIDKLALQLSTMGNEVKIRRNADGTITLVARDNVPPTPAEITPQVRTTGVNAQIKTQISGGELIEETSLGAFISPEGASQAIPPSSGDEPWIYRFNADAKPAVIEKAAALLAAQAFSVDRRKSGSSTDLRVKPTSEREYSSNASAVFFLPNADRRIIEESMKRLEFETPHEYRLENGERGQTWIVPIGSASQTASFPSLEEQKIADRAYKLLGLELEPIDADELARVKKLGYAGGLRIVATDPGRDEPTSLPHFEGDVLVGLHVWPVTDFRSLDAILSRDDLAELSPLKYYLVRNRQRGAAIGNAAEAVEDRVVTGRLPISTDALLSRELSSANQQHAQLEALAPTTTASESSVAPAGEKGPPGASAVRIEPYDTLHIKVIGAFPEEPIDGQYAVEPQGTIALGPTYGRVEVAGLTVLEAEDAVTKQLSEILSDFKVQITLVAWHGFPQRTAAPQSPATVGQAPPPKTVDTVTKAEKFVDLPPATAPPAQPIYLYDGKTFKQWRENWRQELKTEHRLEAIHALSAFARAGYGKEAASAIFDVAAEYNPASGDLLVKAIIESLSRLPADQWAPVVLDRLAASSGEEQARWKEYAARILSTSTANPENRELAMKFLAYADRKLLESVASYLLRSDQQLADPQTAELVRRALQADPPAVDLLFRLQFRHLDAVPEQIGCLLHPGSQRTARAILREAVEQDDEAAARLTESLLAILADPEHNADHVAALRALRAMAAALRKPARQAEAARVVAELGRLLNEGDKQTAVPALWALMRVMKDVPYEGAPMVLQQRGVITPETAARLAEIDQQELVDESNVE